MVCWVNKISQCWTQHQALPNKAQSIITPIHLIPMSIKSSIIYFPIHIHSIENQFSLYAIKCEKEERKLILLQSHFAIILPKLCTNKNNTKIKNFPIRYPLQQHKDWKKMSAYVYGLTWSRQVGESRDLKQSHYYG